MKNSSFKSRLKAFFRKADASLRACERTLAPLFRLIHSLNHQWAGSKTGTARVQQDALTMKSEATRDFDEAEMIFFSNSELKSIKSLINSLFYILFCFSDRRKKYRFIVSLVLLLTFSADDVLKAQEDYMFYYNFEQKVPLEAIENKFLIEFIDERDLPLIQALGFDYTTIAERLFEITAIGEDVESLSNELYYVNRVYTTGAESVLRMRNQIILQWLPNLQQSQIDDLIAEFNLTENRSKRLYNIYDLEQNPLEISQKIYESGLVRYSCPVFLGRAEHNQYMPNDTYFDEQFYFHNTGQQLNDGHFGTADADIDAPEAWDITTGNSDIVVAVVDHGVTSNHPDLPNTRQLRLPGSNITAALNSTDPNDPSPTDVLHHGNACAGIIGAEMDNNEGVCGIAPGCVIMPVVVSSISEEDGFELYYYADAITFAVDNGAHIINCSWNFGKDYQDYNPPVFAALEDAICKGHFVVFAAGNDAVQNLGHESSVKYPANTDIPEIIVVAASDRNDQQANYSPTDEKVDICAPSHTAKFKNIAGEGDNVWTIDNLGTEGNNPYPTGWGYPNPLFPNIIQIPAVGEELPASGTNYLSYSGRFGGTSAAAPQVSGIIALILSVNRCLGMDDVLDILYSTADKVGGYDYNWDINQPGHSKELGYGRANAHQAVLMAQSYNTQCSSQICAENDYLTLCEGEQVKMGMSFINEDCFTYQWLPTSGLSDPNSLNPTFSFSSVDIEGINDVYTLTATSATDPSCSIQATVNVSIPCASNLNCPCSACNNSLLEVNVSDDVICNHSSTQLFANVTSGDSFTYQWFPPWHLDDPFSASPIYQAVIGNFNINGSYTKSFTVTATSVDNPECKLTKTVSVEVLCGNECAICGSHSDPNDPNCQARMQIRPNPVHDHLTIKIDMGRRYIPPIVWGTCPVPPFNGDIKVVHLATRNTVYEGELFVDNDGRGGLAIYDARNWPKGLYLVIFEHDNVVLVSKRIIKL